MREKLSYAIILFILFLTSGSSWLANDKNVIIGGWLFFTAAYFYIENLIKPSFIILTSLFVLLSGVYFIKNSGYNEVTYLGFFMQIYLAYYCRQLCKEDFTTYFINIIFVLTAISIPLYIIQLVNFDFLYHINNLFRADDGDEIIHNSILFTIVPIHEIRNCGFMWEPGALAAVVTLTLYINTFRHEESLFSLKNGVFMLAIVSTQSTMGVLSLMIPVSLVLLKTFSHNTILKQLAVLIVPSLLILGYVLFNNVDFLAKKMADELGGIEEEMAFVEQANREQFLVSTTRTTSVLLDMETIKLYPLLGLGVDMKTTGASKQAIGEMTVTACGTTVLLLRFGVLGLIFYIFLFYKKSFFDNTIHRVGWVFLIFFILFSNDLSGSSLIHLFLF